MSRATLVIVFILTGFSGSHAAQELSPLWAYESQDKIEYFEVTPSGDLFVSSKSEIALVSAKTGEVAWSRDDIRDCKRSSSPYVGGTGPIRSPFYDDAAEELVVCRYLNKRGSEFIVLSNTPYALFGPKERVAVLDWRTGTTLFDSADHPLGKVRKLRYIAQLAQFVLWAEIKKNSYALASIKAGDSGLQWLSETTISKDFEWLGVQGDSTALVYGKDRAGKRILTALNLNTGEVTWQNQDLLKENLKSCCFAPAIYDTEETILLFISKDGPMRLGPGGQLLWRAKDLADEDPSKMVHADGVLFIPQDDRVFAIDTSDGSVIWQEEARFDPTTIEIHARGLLIASDKELDLLDLQTGKPAWTKEVKMPRGWTPEWLSLSRVSGVQLPIVVGNDALYLAAGGALTAVNLEEGSLNEITRYEFKDKQIPTALSLINGDFFLNSTHNVASFDSGGQLLYQRYYKAPGASGWAKAGAIAYEIGAGIIEGLANARERESCYNSISENRVGSQRCQRFLQLSSERFRNKESIEMADVQEAWKDSAPSDDHFRTKSGVDSFYATLAKRYGTTVDTERFIHMYFEEEDKKDGDHQFGLVRFDKRTGKEAGRLWFNERNPKYTLDLAAPTVFFRTSEKVIQALKFDTAQE